MHPYLYCKCLHMVVRRPVRTLAYWACAADTGVLTCTFLLPSKFFSTHTRMASPHMLTSLHRPGPLLPLRPVPHRAEPFPPPRCTPSPATLCPILRERTTLDDCSQAIAGPHRRARAWSSSRRWKNHRKSDGPRRRALACGVTSP